jgi:hypothetical protein
MKLSKCKHCHQEFDISQHPKGWMANHSRWCDKNPKKSTYLHKNINAIEAMNAARKSSGRTNQYSTAKLDGTLVPESPNKGKPGKFKGKTHSAEAKIKISEKARVSTHRRLRKGMIEYNGVMMDSSWEVRLAQRLDAQSIKWTRPNALQYTDSKGRIRHYFPDFYLPE